VRPKGQSTKGHIQPKKQRWDLLQKPNKCRSLCNPPSNKDTV